jgi:hypothetical protein
VVDEPYIDDGLPLRKNINTSKLNSKITDNRSGKS